MFKNVYDVFLAYHGSYDEAGSLKFAERLYDELTGQGYSVFFFPKMSGDAYKANIIDVMQSRTFVLICNKNLHIEENGRIDKMHHYELSTEIDAFYALTQTKGGDVSVQDSKIITIGAYEKGKEAHIHELFANRPHFHIQDGQEDCSEFYEWVKERVSKTNKLENALKCFSGDLYERSELEKILPSEDRLLTNVDGNYIVKKVCMCCYTAGSIINPNGVIRVNKKKAKRFGGAIEFLLNEDDSFSFEVIMTNPNSKAAFEAICNNKIGNKNKCTFYDSYYELKNCIDDEESIFSECWDDGFNCKITDISLPYALMHVEYEPGYEHLNHIKVDLYSPYLENNSRRMTIIVTEKHQRISYNFFAQQIRDISNNARNLKEVSVQEKGIYVYENEMINNSLQEKYRQYLSGSTRFKRGNIENAISFVETGISYYKDFRVDKPHYHETTAEHYIILEGEQKILDLDAKKQYIVKAGDYVFIPPWTKHLSKNKMDTKIFFAKAPDKSDKQELEYEDIEECNEWMGNYEKDY